jgi:C4-type Zn-finger protein
MARGVGGRKKRGSKTKALCPICQKRVTKAGLIGHMAWSHGKDATHPMLPSKMLSSAEKAQRISMSDGFVHTAESPCCHDKLQWANHYYDIPDDAALREFLVCVKCGEHYAPHIRLYEDASGKKKAYLGVTHIPAEPLSQ